MGLIFYREYFKHLLIFCFDQTVYICQNFYLYSVYFMSLFSCMLVFMSAVSTVEKAGGCLVYLGGGGTIYLGGKIE